MYYFCTYFDHHYLSRGLALYRSLRQHCYSFQLWVLCMDHECYDVLSQMNLSNVHLIALEDLESGDRELLRAKQNRTLVEYYFTCTPSLALFILNNYPEVDIITYLDADLFFFSDPTPMYDEIGNNSIAIIAHRFPQSLRDLQRFGIYNVGWVSFRRDERALACLHWWRERCIEWCYDRVENGRFADQKYLDNWPAIFQSVVVLRHKGANLAPWNLANYKIHECENCIWVDEQPLIFFHFHGFKEVRNWLYDPNLVGYGVKASKVVRRSILMPYIRMLDATKQVVSVSQVTPLPRVIRNGMTIFPPHQRGSLLYRVVIKLRWLLWLGRLILNRQYIVVVNGHVI